MSRRITGKTRVPLLFWLRKKRNGSQRRSGIFPVRDGLPLMGCCLEISVNLHSDPDRIEEYRRQKQMEEEAMRRHEEEKMMAITKQVGGGRSLSDLFR